MGHRLPRTSKKFDYFPREPLGTVILLGDSSFWYDTHRHGLWRIDDALAAVLAETLQEGPSHGDAPRHSAARAEIETARRDEGLFLAASPRRTAPRAAPDPAAWERELGHLTLGLTDACNLACGYCPQRLAPAPARTMSPATARAAVAFFLARCEDAPLPAISLYGGEPLLQRDLVAAVVNQVGDRPVRLVVDTNATLVDDAAAAWLAGLGVHLQISCDGPAAVHDRYRRTPDGRPTHAAVLAGVRRLLRADPSVADRLTFIATLGPPFPILEVAAWFTAFPPFRDLGLARAPHVRVNIAAPGGPRPGPEGDERRRQLASAWHEAEQAYIAAHRAGRRDQLSPALTALFDDDLVRWRRRRGGPLPSPGRPGGLCRPGVRRLYVDPEGIFRPCERVGAGQVIGDATRGFDHAAIGRLDARLQDHLDGACDACWAQRLCRLCLTALDEDPAATRSACSAMRATAAAGLRRWLALQDPPAADLSWLDNIDLL